jgi:hypothetical protein
MARKTQSWGFAIEKSNPIESTYSSSRRRIDGICRELEVIVSFWVGFEYRKDFIFNSHLDLKNICKKNCIQFISARALFRFKEERRTSSNSKFEKSEWTLMCSTLQNGDFQNNQEGLKDRKLGDYPRFKWYMYVLICHQHRKFQRLLLQGRHYQLKSSSYQHALFKEERRTSSNSKFEKYVFHTSKWRLSKQSRRP